MNDLFGLWDFGIKRLTSQSVALSLLTIVTLTVNLASGTGYNGSITDY